APHPPPDTAPCAPESRYTLPLYTAKTAPKTPLPYENCNTYTSSGKTEPERKSPAAHSSKKLYHTALLRDLCELRVLCVRKTRNRTRIDPQRRDASFLLYFVALLLLFSRHHFHPHLPLPRSIKLTKEHPLPLP